MSRGSLRIRVLSAYHNILRLARDWKAIEPANTDAERAYIRQEAYNKFRENKQVTDESKILALVQEAESRTVIARHYGIPYDRPAYLPPAASYGGTLNRSTPNKRISNDDRPGPAFCPIRAEVSALGECTDDLRDFIRCYFAGAAISDAVLKRVSPYFADGQSGSQLIQSSLLNTFPPKRSYESAVLKRIISQLEHDVLAPSDCVYERLCHVLGSSTSQAANGAVNISEVFHRVFFDFKHNEFVVILENAEQISGGTTGLVSWQAAGVLAEFFRCGALTDRIGLNRLNFMELGAGCGLTGLAATKFDTTDCIASLLLTDHNERVLERLRENVRLNLETDGRVNISALDWLDYERFESLGLPRPDIVYASDVIYDPDLIAPFSALLSHLLNGKANTEATLPVAFVACTIRNVETVGLFRAELLSQRLSISEEFTCAPGTNYFVSSNGEVHYRFSEIVFPPPSTFLLPVVVLEIRSK